MPTSYARPSTPASPGRSRWPEGLGPSPYGETIRLHRCFDLVIHHDRQTGIVVLEYASEGHVVATGAAYSNRDISVLTLTERKVTRWRDYLDPIAVFGAGGWPTTP
jgi:hypothetical protein